MVQRPQFDNRQKFVVCREFKFAGRLFKVGQEFPWRSIGCSVRRLSQMYNGRKLNMLDAQAPVTEEKLLAMEPEVKPVVKEAKKEVVDASKIDAPAADKVEASTEVADKPKKDKKPKLTDEQKAKKNARRKAARKAAKLAEAKGE